MVAAPNYIQLTLFGDEARVSFGRERSRELLYKVLEFREDHIKLERLKT